MLLLEMRIQITYFSGNKDELKMEYSVFEDSTKDTFIEKMTYVFIPSVADDSLNSLKQGYENLKNQKRI